MGDAIAAEDNGSLAAALTARPSSSDADTSSGLELITKVDAVVTALEQAGEMSAADLATILHEPLSSTYRMLQSLSGIGWVDRGHRRGLYRLGVSVMSIGRLVEGAIDVRQAALPSLQSLLRDTEVTCFLWVRRGPRAVVIERLEGRAVRSLEMQLGSSLPLYSGAGPVTFLAFLPESERELVLASRSEMPGDPSRPSADRLKNVLAGVRERGYAISDGDVTAGIGSLGAPVFNHRHELVATVSISGLSAHVLGARLPRNSALLLAAAHAVSSSLGDEAGP